MSYSPEQKSIDVQELTYSTARKLNLLNGAPTWDIYGNIYIDNTSEKNDQIHFAIQQSKQQVNLLTNHFLKLETRALQNTRNENVYFQNIGEYITYLEEKKIVDLTDVNPVQARIGYQSLLADHWVSAINQVERNKHNISNWEEFYKSQLWRDTRWQTVTYLEELEKGSSKIDARKGVYPDITNSRDTLYSTHTTKITYAGPRIVQEGFIDSERNNISQSAVVTATNIDDITFLFKTEDLLQAVPFIYGEGVSHENEIRTFFPIDIRLARSVFPSSIMQKHVPKDEYYYRGYPLNANKLYEIE